MLIALLIDKFSTAAKAAAALGISRQAFSQAAKRGRFSDSVILRATELLSLDAGALLLQRAQLTTRKPEDSPLPVPCPADDNGACQCNSLYYVKSKHQKESRCASEFSEKKDNGNPENSQKNAVHAHVSTLPNYEKNQLAIDIIRWCLCVPRISPDSPRFAYYVSRWRVPDKIAAAKEDGTFEDAVKNCPHFNPAFISLIPAAIAEYEAFIMPAARPQSSADQSRPVKSKNLMYA